MKCVQRMCWGSPIQMQLSCDEVSRCKNGNIKSLCLTAFVDLETLNWMETSRPDPEDEAKVQAHEVLGRKPWKLSLQKSICNLFSGGRCPQMEGQRTRKGEKDCTTASCRATLCDTVFFAKSLHRIPCRRDDDDDWQLTSSEKCRTAPCKTVRLFWHVTLSNIKAPLKSQGCPFPPFTTSSVASPRRSLPWQTVFCFHAWLDFVRFGVPKHQICSGKVGTKCQTYPHILIWCCCVMWNQPVCPCTVLCRSFFLSAPWEVRQLFQFSRVPFGLNMCFGQCQQQFNNLSGSLTVSSAEIKSPRRPTLFNLEVTCVFCQPCQLGCLGFGWGSLLGLLGRALERGTSTYSKFGGDFFFLFFVQFIASKVDAFTRMLGISWNFCWIV